MFSKILKKPAILEVPIASLKLPSSGWRGISEEAYKGLFLSLKKFGYVDLIIVNKRKMEIVSGQQRFKILKDAGVESVLCVAVDLNDIEQRVMSISLNSQEICGYFTEALIPVLEELRQSIPEDYLDLRLSELRESCEQLEQDKIGKTMPDDIPEGPKETKTKKGDLWILGNHRLLCGDSTNPEDVDRLMDGCKASLLATDPPYCIDYTGADRPNGGKDWSETFREFEIKDAFQFWYDFMSLGLQYCESNSAIYFWYASSRYVDVDKVFKSLNLLTHQQLIWVKPCINLTFSIYPWRHEPCVFGWIKGNKPFFRPSRKKIGTVWSLDFLRSGDPATPEYHTDVWELDYEGSKRPKGGMHPTVKPVECFAIPMRVHTNPGGICYEPFSGSGSQIIAGEITNRHVYAMEMESTFVDVAVKRWEDFTGEKARRV